MRLRLLLFAVGRVMSFLVGAFGLAFDATGSNWFQSSANWGLIGLVAFCVFGVLTGLRELDLALQQRPKVDIHPRTQAGVDIDLLVDNTSDTSGDFTATMTCSADYGGAMQDVRQTNLMNVSMLWEASGKANERIHGHGQKVLKLCSVERPSGIPDLTHRMCFYKVESDRMQKVDCGSWSADTAIPRVNVQIQLDSDPPIRGRNSWRYRLEYLKGNNMIAIYDQS